MAGIYRRGKTWWGRVQRQGRELRRSLKTTNKTIADQRLRKWVDDLDATSPSGKQAHLFTVAAEKFAAEHCPTLRPGAAKRYGVSMMHLVDAFAGLRLHEITSGKLWDFETKRRGQGVRPPTVRRDLACLSSIFGCAIEWEWIDANPIPVYTARRRRKGLKEAPARTRYLDSRRRGSPAGSGHA